MFTLPYFLEFTLLKLYFHSLKLMYVVVNCHFYGLLFVSLAKYTETEGSPRSIYTFNYYNVQSCHAVTGDMKVMGSSPATDSLRWCSSDGKICERQSRASERWDRFCVWKNPGVSSHLARTRIYFLARRDECPESYCRTPGVGVHKSFNLAYNSWTTTGTAFIFHICIPCDKTFPWVLKVLT